MQNLDEIARSLAGNLSPEQLREKWESRGMAHSANSVAVAVTDEGRAHLARVSRARCATNTGAAFTRTVRQEMEHEKARVIIGEMLHERAKQITMLENRKEMFVFEFDKEEKERNANLLKYFINDPTCAFSLTKGLFVYGATGTSKTELMQILERFTAENKLSKAFKFSSLSKVYTDAKANADFDPIAPNVCFDRCFDEFGRYVGAVKRYGDDLDINEAILEQRYERFKRYGQLTHLIANLTPNETAEKFSPMLVDRIRSMCTGIYFKGESKRK